MNWRAAFAFTGFVVGAFGAAACAVWACAVWGPWVFVAYVVLLTLGAAYVVGRTC